MPLVDTHSAIGATADQPIRHGTVVLAVKVLRETIEDLVTDAKLKARASDASAAAIAGEQVIALSRAVDILEGHAGLLAASEAAAPPAVGPVEHRCTYPGCGAAASNGFGLPPDRERWACNVHKADIQALWEHERADRLRQVQQQMTPAQGDLLRARRSSHE